MYVLSSKDKVFDAKPEFFNSDVNEAADVIYHLLVYFEANNIKYEDIINELKTDEFLDFIRADFGVAKMVKLATHHPKMVVRQLFNMVKGT